MPTEISQTERRVWHTGILSPRELRNLWLLGRESRHLDHVSIYTFILQPGLPTLFPNWMYFFLNLPHTRTHILVVYRGLLTAPRNPLNTYQSLSFVPSGVVLYFIKECALPFDTISASDLQHDLPLAFHRPTRTGKKSTITCCHSNLRRGDSKCFYLVQFEQSLLNKCMYM